jgi:hypothetical protein
MKNFLKLQIADQIYLRIDGKELRDHQISKEIVI